MPLETTPVPASISPSVHPVLPPTARTDSVDGPCSPDGFPAANDAASIPDQPDADLNRLGDRIAELSARIQAATCALLVLIRQFDEQGGWRPGGFSSCAHWLSWRTGLAPGAAREKVRVAHALAALPRVSAAMQQGRVSYSKVRALTRVATPENEAALLDVALAGTAVHVEQVTRAWRRVDRAAEIAEDGRRHAHRELRTWVDDDGMVVIRGRLAPEAGAAVLRALDAASEQLRTEAADAPEEDAPEASSEQRRADALGRVAEAALSAQLDPGTAGDRYQVVLHVDAATLALDAAAAQGADHPAYVPAGTSSVVRPTAAGRTAAIRQPGGDAAAGVGGPQGAAGDSVDSAPTGAASTGGEHVPAGTRRPAGADGSGLDDARCSRRSSSESAAAGGADGPSLDAAARAAHGGQAVLEDAGGLRVSTETAQRLACDAGRVVMTHGAAGQVLGVGRKARTIPPALRRALAARDRRCRFPGCTARRCDAHHVRHWAHGGATRLDNLVQLCRRHHRAVHEGGLRVTFDDAGAVRFTRAGGRPLPEVPEPPRWTGAALAPVDARLAAAGTAIGPGAALPAWTGERLDLGWAMSVLWRPRASPTGAASDGPTPPPA